MNENEPESVPNPPEPEAAPPVPDAAPPVPDAAPPAPPAEPATAPEAPHPLGAHDLGPVISSDPGTPAPAPAPGASETGAPDEAPVPPYAYPTQPNAAYPGQPGTEQPHPAPAYAAQGEPKKGLSKGALFGILGGALALILVIAAVIIVPLAIRGAAPTAADAVETYLTAIAEGDAETALTLVESYGDDALLTDDVLAASNGFAPMDDIEVGEVKDEDEYETTVPVSFTLGGTPFERQYTVYKGSEDEWLISDGLISVSGFAGLYEGLGFTMNGVEVPETALVFPGTYELALGVDEFVLGDGESTFTFASDQDTELVYELQPELTEEAAATFRTLVQQSLAECVAMKTLSTPCGMDLTDIDLDGYTPLEGTVTRTITAEGQSTLDSLTADIDSGTIVSSYDSIDVEATLEGELNGERAGFDVWIGGYPDIPTVDFAEENPEVVWE